MTQKPNLSPNQSQLLSNNISAKLSDDDLLPNQLTAVQYQELNLGSGIHPDLIKLNFFYLAGNAALDRLFISDRLSRINTGAVSYSVLKRYRHVEQGGWWVSGVNVLNDYQDDIWGQFKPLQPRLSADKGKIIKYEAPPKYPTGIIALQVSQQIWHKIAKLNNLKLFFSAVAFKLSDRNEPISFWEWVVNHPEIPLIITEGAKKAAALLSQGYAAIALPGVFNGYRQPKDEFGRKTGLAKLIPQLEVFAKPGRTIYFAFDRDTKANTIANVNKAIAKTGKLLVKAEVQVKVISWLEPAKGVDDLIVIHGSEAFHHAYNNALTLETWLVQTQVQLTYPVNINLNQRYLGSLANRKQERSVPRSLFPVPSQTNYTQLEDNQKDTDPHQVTISTDKVFSAASESTLKIPDDAKLICLKSPKGTGKTHLLEQIVNQATREGKWVLLLTHRIQLGEALCQRVGLPYLTEIKTVEYGTILGYGLCIDSLHPNSGARFNANNWEDGIVIIDEAEQVIWHLLNSATCTQERVEILTQFKTLIQNNLSGEGKVYLADADLSNVAIDYIISLAGFHVDPFVVVNDWQPSKEQRWTIHNYEDKNPANLVRDLVSHIRAGGKPFISCSAQRLQSKWGTQNLESYLQLEFPDHKILRIDSETVADPQHSAYGCIAHLNEILPQYDIAIASPSIETGVSIECKRQITPYTQIPLAFELLLRGVITSLGQLITVPHFTSVWAIAQGVQTADSIRQVLARNRSNVPRYLWAAKRGFHKCMVGNGTTIKKALIASTKNKASTNIRFLQAADASLSDLDLNSNFQPESLNTWAKKGCYINLTMQNYRSSIVEGLIKEGHLVTTPPKSQADTLNSAPGIETQLKQIATSKYQVECGQIADSPNPTDSELQKLKDKRAKTKPERWIERKGNLVRRYGEDIPITPEIVAQDDRGWYSQILFHYYLTVGRPYLIDRDSRQLRAIAANTKNRLWIPDLNRSLLSTPLRLLETLITGLLKPGVKYRGSDPNLQLVAELALSNQRELKTFLGLTIVKSDTPIKIAQKLLSLLGLKLTYIGRLGSRARRERVYVFQPPNDSREKIFKSWLKRDRAFISSDQFNNSETNPNNLNLLSVSTIGKDNYLSSTLDFKEKENLKSQVSSIQSGTTVKWLTTKEQWMVKATTGIVAKIINKRGKEVMVNCQELEIQQKEQKNFGEYR